MRIFYFLSSYISHRLTGVEYIRCLQHLGHEVGCNYPEILHACGEPVQTSLGRISLAFCEDPALLRAAREADLVILHEDPALYAPLYERLGFLREKAVVSYLPWENELLPESFIEPLSWTKAIWTCSSFCRDAFKKAYTHVDVLPHVVSRPKLAHADIIWARELMAAHGAADAFWFFSVQDGLNPRKNLAALLTAFSVLRRESKVDVRLVVKQYRAAMPLEHAGIINITDMLSEGRMAALYASCGAYISPHHAEGWGLGLSTAMSFGKISIATAYSGNLEFMNNRNSMLLPYHMAPVSEEMIKVIPLFTREMQWAEVDMPTMIKAMHRAAHGMTHPSIGLEAAQITQRFGQEQVEKILERLLRQL